MAIRKINEINEVGELNQLSQDVQNTVLQALINQGQRVSFAEPNSDGYDPGWDPGYNSFTFKDLLSINVSVDSNIGIIEKNEGIYTFSYVAKNKLDEYLQILPDKVEISESDNFFSEILPSGNRLLSSSNVENIRNLKVLKDSTKMVFSCIGSDANDNDFEFLLEEVDYTTNELLYGLRILKEDVLLPSISLVYIKKNGTKYTENVYNINKNYNSLSDLLDSISDTINIDSNTSFDNLFENIIYSLLSEFDEHYLDIEVDSIFDIVKPVSIENLGTVTKYFEYDLKYLYRDIKEYIFEKEYSDQNLKLRILTSIYDEIQKEENTTSRIFIPLDYQFTYTYNKTNPWQIYHSVDDIVVNYIYRLNANLSDFNLIDSTNSALIAISSSKGAIKVITFSVKYDKDNDFTVLDIPSKSKYSLPYINEEGKWIINGTETGVKAHGINAGNPNIIFLHLYKNGDDEEITEFLTGINPDTDNIGYIKSEVKIEPYSYINKNLEESEASIDYITVETPIIDKNTINEDNFYIVEKSLIISVTHTDFIVNEEQKTKIEKYYGTSGTITSLWSVVKEDGEYKCKVLSKNLLNDLGEIIDEVAIDFNYLTNVNNVINYALEGFEQEYPDKYTHSRLLFDGIKNTLKQQSSSNEIEYYIPYLNVREENGNRLNFTFNVSTLSYTGESEYYETLTEDEDNRKFKNIQEDILQAVKERSEFFRDSVTPIDTGNGEYIPTFDIPTLDLSTVLTKKETLLNKLDILTLNNSGDLFLSYIGVNLDDENLNSVDKAPVFTIGTTDTRDSFRTQSNIDINFSNITLNGETLSNGNITSNESIISNKNIWRKNQISEISESYSYQCQYTPLGKYNTSSNVVLYIDDEQYLDESTIDNWVNSVESLTELYIPVSFHDPNISRNTGNQELAGQDIHIYFADAIYIPKLLENLNLENIINLDNDFSYKIKFNNNDYNNIIIDSTSHTELYDNIIYINEVPVFLILNSSNLECNYPANQPAEFNIDNKLYTSNQLDILCYQEEDDWVFEINEISQKERYSIPYKLKLNY